MKSFRNRIMLCIALVTGVIVLIATTSSRHSDSIVAVIPPEIQPSLLLNPHSLTSPPFASSKSHNRSDSINTSYRFRQMRKIKREFSSFVAQNFSIYFDGDEITRQSLESSFTKKYLHMRRIAKSIGIQIDEKGINREVNSRFQLAQQGAAANP